jgi:predicted nucleotidyltransferase
MLNEWKKFAGWKVLEYFLAHSSSEFYIRQLSRLLKTSPRSVQIYCNSYAEDGLLFVENKANVRMFWLDNSKPIVRSLKQFNFIRRLEELNFTEQILKSNPNMLTLAIYGSYASGNYDENSDIDILVVSDKKFDRSQLTKFQQVLGKQIQLTEVTTAQLFSLKNKKDLFLASVINNHIILFGGRL